MRVLQVVYRAGALEGDWAAEGECAVPNLPTGARNTFIGLDSFKPAPYAKVVALEGITLTELAAKLKARFKSLPSELLDAYVLQTAMMAHDLPLDTICQCYIDDDGDHVTLRDVKTGAIHTLWEQQPIPARYK